MKTSKKSMIEILLENIEPLTEAETLLINKRNEATRKECVKMTKLERQEFLRNYKIR